MLKIKEKQIGQKFKYRGHILEVKKAPYVKSYNFFDDFKPYDKCLKCCLLERPPFKKTYWSGKVKDTKYCSIKHRCIPEERSDNFNIYFLDCGEI